MVIHIRDSESRMCAATKFLGEELNWLDEFFFRLKWGIVFLTENLFSDSIINQLRFFASHPNSGDTRIFGDFLICIECEIGGHQTAKREAE